MPQVSGVTLIRAPFRFALGGLFVVLSLLWAWDIRFGNDYWYPFSFILTCLLGGSGLCLLAGGPRRSSHPDVRQLNRAGLAAAFVLLVLFAALAVFEVINLVHYW